MKFKNSLNLNMLVLRPAYYLGKYNKTMYLDKNGFDLKQHTGFLYEQFYNLEENQTIDGRRV